MIEFLRRTSAAVAVMTALVFSPAAQAAEAGHPGHPGGGIHMGGGGGGAAGGGGTPFGGMPHKIAPGFQSGGVKHNYGGNTVGPIGIAPHQHQNTGQNAGPGIVLKHPGGGGVTKHWDRDGDHDGDHHEDHARHHRGHLFVYGVPTYDNYYDDSYGDDTCRYFWHRYQQTGNPKWKWRYYDCIG